MVARYLRYQLALGSAARCVESLVECLQVLVGAIQGIAEDDVGEATS